MRVLGFGGFGMTYLGFDHNLDKAVAIKEYLPSDIATRTGDNSVAPQASQFRDDFEWGLDRFLDEARTLARFDHRHIIKVHRYFQAHGTAYIVMEYAEGETLSSFLQSRGTLSEAELEDIVYPILDGLEVVHRADFLHRDIKPGNIIIRAEDHSPVLLDFGAARQAIGSRSRSVTSIITPGYAPIEQYSTRDDQGPWTDIYALGAVCYQALTGQVPDDATDRMRNDPLIPVSARCAGQASAGFLSAIDSALQVNEEDRPQSIAEWRVMLEDEEPPPPPPSSEKSGGKLFAAIFCIVALLIGGVSYYQYAYLPTQRRQAQEAAKAEVAQEREKKISDLLSAATEDMSRDRLTSPAGANAWEKYQAVLALEPGHKIASAGLDRIIDRYVSKFEASLRSKDFAEAEGYVSRIQSVYADAPMLSELADRLSVAQEADRQRREAEAARHRQAAAEAERLRQSKIARYEGKFEEAMNRNNVAMADRYVDSLRVVNAPGSLLSALTDRLSATEQRVGRRFKDCADCPEMVVVPSGSFMMGSPGSEEGRQDNEGPRHRVNIGYPLAVGVYEVTRREFSKFVSDTGYNAGNCHVWNSSSEKWEAQSGLSWRNPDYTQTDSHPVVCVSWKDAQSYVRWLSEKTGHRYSLLSESEWEYVARAGTDTPFYFGSTISTDQANYNGDYIYGGGRKGVDRGKTVSVGSFRANGWGVYDMHGNVWERVQDCWNDSYVGIPVDGSSWESGDCGKRVRRGGSWGYEPRYLRFASRSWSSTDFRDNYNGFRVVRRF